MLVIVISLIDHTVDISKLIKVWQWSTTSVRYFFEIQFVWLVSILTELLAVQGEAWGARPLHCILRWEAVSCFRPWTHAPANNGQQSKTFTLALTRLNVRLWFGLVWQRQQGSLYLLLHAGISSCLELATVQNVGNIRGSHPWCHLVSYFGTIGYKWVFSASGCWRVKILTVGKNLMLLFQPTRRNWEC